MSRPVLKVAGYTPEMIAALFRDDERYTIGIRLYAVYQVSKGQSSRKLEELYNTSFKQITNWVHQFEAEGIDGLRDKPKPGRPSGLSEAQKELLKELISHELPSAHGYNTDTWTGPLLLDWIEKTMKVTYKKAQIYNILKGLGFTHKRGRGIYPEADAEKQAEFADTLKKTSGKP
jgi:transposase